VSQSDRPWDEIPALLEMIEEMRSQGNSEEQIAGYLGALDERAFHKANAEMRDAGVPEDVIEGFWREMAEFGDATDDDSIDADDEDHGAAVGGI